MKQHLGLEPRPLHHPARLIILAALAFEGEAAAG